jgi:hypothetical protein
MKTQNVPEGTPADLLLRLLACEMRISFERLQKRVAAQSTQEGLP